MWWYLQYSNVIMIFPYFPPFYLFIYLKKYIYMYFSDLDSSEPPLLCHSTTRTRGHWKGTTRTDTHLTHTWHTQTSIHSTGCCCCSISCSLHSLSFSLFAFQACGVDFEIRAFCAKSIEEKIHKRWLCTSYTYEWLWAWQTSFLWTLLTSITAVPRRTPHLIWFMCLCVFSLLRGQ